MGRADSLRSDTAAGPAVRGRNPAALADDSSAPRPRNVRSAGKCCNPPGPASTTHHAPLQSQGPCRYSCSLCAHGPPVPARPRFPGLSSISLVDPLEK